MGLVIPVRPWLGKSSGIVLRVPVMDIYGCCQRTDSNDRRSSTFSVHVPIGQLSMLNRELRILGQIYHIYISGYEHYSSNKQSAKVVVI